MANPTPLPRSRRDDRKGMGLECGQIIINGEAVLGGQHAAIADVAAPAAYTAPDISAAYVEAEVQAIADALAALRATVAAGNAKINAVIAALEDVGIFADA